MLPNRIEALEAEQSALVAAMSSPKYHDRPVEDLRADSARMKAIEDELAQAYDRWEALEAKREAAEKA